MGPYFAPTRMASATANATATTASAAPCETPSPLTPPSCDSHQQHSCSAGGLHLHEAGHDDPSLPLPPSSQYDLYGVVHHVGAMGGGHYVTTARDRKGGATPPAAGAVAASRTSSSSDLGNLGNIANGSCSGSGNGSASVGSHPDSLDTIHNSNSNGNAHGPAPGGPWWCFNDESVTPVANPNEVCAASAYVLFYMRRDVWGKDVNHIFEQSTGMSAEQLVSAMPSPASTPLPLSFNGKSGVDGERDLVSQQEQEQELRQSTARDRSDVDNNSPSRRTATNGGPGPGPGPGPGSPPRTRNPPSSSTKAPASTRKSPAKSRELEQKLNPRIPLSTAASDDGNSCVTA